MSSHSFSARSGGVDLTEGSIPRHLIGFSLPMLIGNAIQAGYNIVNSIWVGNGIGTEALGAVAISFPVFFLMMAVSGGLSLAASVLVSQAYGAKDYWKMRLLILNSIFLTAVMALLCLGLAYEFVDGILVLMRTPPEVMPQATGYLKIILWTIIPMFGLFLLSSILRGMGDSKTPLKFQMGALILAAVLDPLLMFGWLGFPKLGLDGTAYATVIAQTAGLVALIIFLNRRNHIALPDWKGFRPDMTLCLLTLKIGIPGIFQQAMISISMIILFGLVNGFGKNGVAAFGAAMRIDQLAFLPAMSIGTAVSTMVGQNLGAGKHERVTLIFWWAIALTLGITLFATTAAVWHPEHILRLFTADADVIAIGVHYLQIVGVGYLLFAVMFVSNGVINGAGHTTVTTVITIAAQWLVRLPMATFLSAHLKRIEGIWFGMLLGFSVGMTLSLLYFFSGRWKRGIALGPRKIPEIIEEVQPIEPVL